MSTEKPTNTFQDNLYETLKIFWKAGYAYRHNQEKNNDLFYTKLMEDLLELPQEEFLIKYKYYAD